MSKKIIQWFKGTSLKWKFFYLPRKISYLTLKSIFTCHIFKRVLLQSIFDAARNTSSFMRGGLLLSAGQSELFVVSSNDQAIGRSTFVNGGEPFDFEKMEFVFKLLNLNSPQELLIDIGANIGTICIPAVKRGYFKTAIAIEPDPLNYKLLTANILLNDLQASVIPRNAALGNHANKVLQFELSSENHGDHRVRVTDETGDAGYDEGNRKTIDVSSTTLDSLFQVHKLDAGVMWMDTQGYEGFILEGASHVLDAGLPLVTEFWPYGMDRANCFENFKKALLKSKFTAIYDLNRPLHVLELNEVSLNSLYSLYKDSKTNGSTDLVFI
ncbi:methyltransferase, FkbM family [Polynucleobacter duraquae]|uniref:Methyltransferase, FkbM family n=1 Tax=Polynucleobacter duraquae TaxID=1835254 RepID=A0A0E3ZKI7_9BURK|nr:FkbM family methyltransferase [Polynucleobacter duraquae]AKD25755.1 methyltransferase, FkbM family [Polynucleobacter duraquae]